MGDSEDPPPPEDADNIHKPEGKPTEPSESDAHSKPEIPSESKVTPETPVPGTSPEYIVLPDAPVKHCEPTEPPETLAPSEPVSHTTPTPEVHLESSVPPKPADPLETLAPSSQTTPTPEVHLESSVPPRPTETSETATTPNDSHESTESTDGQSNNQENNNGQSEIDKDEDDYSDPGNGSEESPPPENDQHIENGVENAKDQTTASNEETKKVIKVLPSDFYPELPCGADPIMIPNEPVADPVVSRERWGAKPPRKPIPQRKGLASRVILSHTGSEYCVTEESCTRLIQTLQENFMRDMGNIDLPYNFMVGGDGRVYEGRGWHGLAPFPKLIPDKYNDGRYLEIAFVGDYGKDSLEMPTEVMVQARRKLVKFGDEQGFLEKKEIITTILAKI